MSSDGLRVALLLSEIPSSIGSFGMVCKTNKLALRMFIHNHQVKNESGDDEEDDGEDQRYVLNSEAVECFKKCLLSMKRQNNVDANQIMQL